MKIHKMKQRSAEWHEIRTGKLTGTGAGSWLTEAPKNRMTIRDAIEELKSLGVDVPKRAKREALIDLLPDDEKYLSQTDLFFSARRKATAKLIGSLCDVVEPPAFDISPEDEPPTNRSMWAIWNGMRREPEAVAMFEADTGLTVNEVGFCEHDSGMAGVSPDGLIDGANEGFEGKCPLVDTHIEYILAGVLPPVYRDQVHFSMAVTGADAWWFQSYCPGAIKEVFRLRVERDEYTEAMEAGLERFAAHAKSEIKRLLK